MANPKPSNLSPAKKSEALRRHQIQVVLQIAVPLGVGVLLALALAVAAALSPAVTAQGGSAAAILLALLCLLGGLPVLLVLAGAVVLMHRAPRAVHHSASRTLGFLQRVQRHVRRWSDRAAAPWVRLEGWRAGAQRLLRRRR